MGGCFSGQKAPESESAPVQAPVSPKAPVPEPAAPAPAPAPAPATESVVETPKEEPLVDVSETKEEVKKEEAEIVPKEAEVVAEPAAAPADEKNVTDEKELEAVSVVKDEAAAPSATEDKISAAL